MIKGLYVASTAMMTNVYKMDVVSNNLANINTTGYKRDTLEVESFNNRLFTRLNGSNIPFDMKAPEVETKVNNGEYTVSTNSGYLKVNTVNGIDYSKGIKFIKDKDGYLRTIYKNAGGQVNPLRGEFILGNKGPIYIGDSEFEIDEKGNVVSGGTVIDNLLTLSTPSVIGTMSAGIRRHTVMTDFEQGQMEMTNSKFDVAIRGSGFFNVESEAGNLLSRDGSFTLNQNGELVQLDGRRVLGIDGPIVITSESFYINEFGEIIQNDEITDKLLITDYTNLGDIVKVGTTFFMEKPEEKMTGEKIEFTGEVVQGFIEKSNSEAISEMIRLIELNRNYESSQKVVTTIDEMIGKCVNEVGRV